MLLGNEGDGTDLPVKGLTAAISRDFMKYRVAYGCQCVDIAGNVPRLALVNPLLNATNPGQQVGITKGQHCAIEHWPTVQKLGNTPQVNNRPKVRFIKGESPLFQGIIGQLDLYRHFHRHDIPHLPLVLVFQGVIRIKFQLIQAEAVRQRDGVRPGHVRVKSNADKGKSVQGSTRDIVFTR